MQRSESTRAPHPPQAEPSLGSALERTYEAGQQYVNDRLELALLDLQRGGRRVALAAAASGVGAVLALLGWLSVMGALVLWDARVAPETRLLALGLVHLVVGGAALYAGLQRARRERAEGGEGGEGDRGPERGPAARVRRGRANE